MEPNSDRRVHGEFVSQRGPRGSARALRGTGCSHCRRTTPSTGGTVRRRPGPNSLARANKARRGECCSPGHSAAGEFRHGHRSRYRSRPESAIAVDDATAWTWTRRRESVGAERGRTPSAGPTKSGNDKVKMKTRRDRYVRVRAIVGLAAAASFGCGGEESDPVVVAGDASHLADCEVADPGPPTPDCRNAGNECTGRFYCISIFSTDRYECNPEPILDRCPTGYCMTQSNSCRPAAGGYLCNSTEDCCEGYSCTAGRCETR